MCSAESRRSAGLRIAVLVKQVTELEDLRLGPDGRLVRRDVPMQISAYCRRAISKGVEFARMTDGTCCVFTLGPPSARDVLREAVAWGADQGVLISDPAFAGSDTLATARALAAALEREGPFDLILAGRNSTDADTGQVGPQIAQFLDLPFIHSVVELELDGRYLAARCVEDDGWRRLTVRLPAVVAAAERLCRPAKADPGQWPAPGDPRLRHIRAADLPSPGPWGESGSPTRVGRVETLHVARERRRLRGPVHESVATAVEAITRRQREVPGQANRDPVPPPRNGNGPVVAILVEPGRPRMTRELAGAAAGLARTLGGTVAALSAGKCDARLLGTWGVDLIVAIEGAGSEEDVARAVSGWMEKELPWALLAPSTEWGRHVAARIGAALGAGLTGDAIGLEVEDGRLVAWKPAMGGRLVAAITSLSPVQMATVRPGVLPLYSPRDGAAAVRSVRATARGRVKEVERVRDDDPDALAAAAVVVGVGMGVPPQDYPLLKPLLDVLGAELAATRKVTDNGWLPHSRQVGLTGHMIAPCLYIAIGLSGKFNHMVGVQRADTILAINSDPNAPVFEQADFGIIGDWREIVPALAQAFGRAGKTEDPLRNPPVTI